MVRRGVRLGGEGCSSLVCGGGGYSAFFCSSSFWSYCLREYTICTDAAEMTLPAAAAGVGQCKREGAYSYAAQSKGSGVVPTAAANSWTSQDHVA
eukprot:5273727-Prymnesium_polylepis.1